MAEYKDVELLKKQIDDFKRAVNSIEPMNSDYLTGYISALSVVEGEIAEQPAADVAPVCHGYWIPQFVSKRGLSNHFVCSECAKSTFTPRKFEMIKYAYCPYCGAKMDGKEDDKNAKL